MFPKQIIKQIHGSKNWLAALRINVHIFKSPNNFVKTDTTTPVFSFCIHFSFYLFLFPFAIFRAIVSDVYIDIYVCNDFVYSTQSMKAHTL